MTREEALAVVFAMADHGAEDMSWYAEDFARGDTEDDTAEGYRGATAEYEEACRVLGEQPQQVHVVIDEQGDPWLFALAEDAAAFSDRLWPGDRSMMSTQPIHTTNPLED